MKFKGDIIITDPCYIMKSVETRAKELGITLPEYPSGTNWSDYSRLLDVYYRVRTRCDDWNRCNYGSDMEVLGFTTYISESTIYGDWSCSTWSTPRRDVKLQLEELNSLLDKEYNLIMEYGKDSVQAKIYDDKITDATIDMKKIGNFCADAGMVGVFLLDEVLKYNPDFNYHIKREWTTTLIKDFDGDINYYVDSDREAHIIGVGSINFFTTQAILKHEV